MSIDQFERASRAWPILVETAARREVITYADLGLRLDVHHRAIRYVLSVIQDYCLEEKHPPLTVLVVNKQGIPGSGFIALGNLSLEEGKEQVFDFDWKGYENPFSTLIGGESFYTHVNELANNPSSSGSVYASVANRGFRQMMFRSALLKVYARKCAVTDVNLVETLQACHIVPWSEADERERLDVRNGILLNSFHHLLFDSGLVTINTKYHIFVRKSLQNNSKASDIQHALTTNVHGRKLRVPHKVSLRPHVDYINRHNQEMRWTNAELEYP